MFYKRERERITSAAPLRSSCPCHSHPSPPPRIVVLVLLTCKILCCFDWSTVLMNWAGWGERHLREREEIMGLGSGFCDEERERCWVRKRCFFFFFWEWGEKKMLVEREGTNEYFNSGVEYFTLKNCFTELLSSKQK